MSKVRMTRTLNRNRGLQSPTEADRLCPFFKERFFQWGSMDKVGCCELDPVTYPDVKCNYRYQFSDESTDPPTVLDPTPICLRYDYTPFEIIEDGVAPTTPLQPIPYVENSPLVQETDPLGQPLYWDNSVNPPVKTTIVTPDPVMVHEKKEWFSKQYVDTHQKKFGIRNNQLGWHHF